MRFQNLGYLTPRHPIRGHFEDDTKYWKKPILELSDSVFTERRPCASKQAPGGYIIILTFFSGCQGVEDKTKSELIARLNSHVFIFYSLFQWIDQ